MLEIHQYQLNALPVPHVDGTENPRGYKPETNRKIIATIWLENSFEKSKKMDFLCDIFEGIKSEVNKISYIGSLGRYVLCHVCIN